METSAVEIYRAWICEERQTLFGTCIHYPCGTRGVLYVFHMMQTFLADHDTDAGMVAYDRPSPKMLSFLSKHYGRADVHPAFAPLTAI